MTHDISANRVAVGIPAIVVETVEKFFVKARNKGRFEPTIGMSYEEKRVFYEKRFY